MSWLSKRFGGNTLKLGAALVGSYLGGKYLFGDSVTTSGGYYEYGADLSGGEFVKASTKFAGTDLVSQGFNKLGITPFRDTGVGSFLSPALDFVKDSGLGNLIVGGGGIAGAMTQFSRFPKARRLQSRGVRSDTNFQASRATMIPLGTANARMLQNPRVRSYLAKRAQMVGLPSAKVVQPNVTVGGSTLSATTASKKLARARIVS